MIINKKSNLKINDLINFDEAKELSKAPLSNALIQKSFRTKKDAFGDIITYSPKVFLPLTFLCRDVCHYCTFAKTPKKIVNPYMPLDEVLEVVTDGEEKGCKEALITLGDKPELRYKTARDYLSANGFKTTLDYVKKTAEHILDNSSLIPHLNVGTLTPEDILGLKDVSGSMGLMLETHSARLSEKGMPHFGSPDKDPEYRLQTFINAGEQQIPFTTGLLIGIGESREERIQSLMVINEMHNRYGNIQEVIIQNFKPKKNTLMSDFPEPSFEELQWTIVMARKILSNQISIQVPPNLNQKHLSCLTKSGIDDFGGISPVTIDHVNPEAPWPEIEKLEKISQNSEQILLPRSTIAPKVLKANDLFIAKEIRSKIQKITDGSGLLRDDGWESGRSTEVPDILPTGEVGQTRKLINEIADNPHSSIPQLFNARGKSFEYITKAADEIRSQLNGNNITYVVNRNINYTNICVYSCSFCAFSKSTGAKKLRGASYLLELEEIQSRVREAIRRGATEVCLQGGIHPKFDGNYYLDVIKAIRKVSPDIHIHAFSPLEIFQGAHTLGLTLEEYLPILKEAGLNSLPGTAAEILHDDVRDIICPDKLNTAEWLSVMDAAHMCGLNSTATIMFGHVETYDHIAEHLINIKNQQIKSGGFTEFVPLPFVAHEAPMSLRGQSRSGPTFREAILMHSISRIFFQDHIPNIQGSWVKMGYEGLRKLLSSGINDVGGILMDETITRSAGANHGQELDLGKIQLLTEELNLKLVRRNTNYETISSSKRSTLIDQDEIPMKSINDFHNEARI